MAEGEQAIALDPNDADGYARLSLVLLCMGQPEEAIRLIEKAMRLNPRYPAWYLLWLGHAYSSAGRLEDAITTQKRAVTVNPNFPGPHIALRPSIVA